MILKGKNTDDIVQSLAFGESYRELMVGSSSLKMYSIDYDNNREHKECWSKQLANLATYIQFSPDNFLFASAYLKHDKLIKIWKRSSYDLDSLTWDFMYAPHPAPVQRFWWAKPLYKNQTVKNTLYSVAVDGVLRIWRAYTSSDPGNLQLWGSIDIGSPEAMTILCEYSLLRKTIDDLAVTDALSSKELMDKAVSIGSSNSDMLIVTDPKCATQLKVYCISNTSSSKGDRLCTISEIFSCEKIKYRGDVRPFNVYGSCSVQPLVISPDGHKSPGELLFFVHDFLSRSIYFVTASLAEILKGAGSKSPSFLFFVRTVITGHYKSVQNIIRSSDGNALLSQSRFSENYVWKPRKLMNGGVTLSKVSYIQTGITSITKAILVESGNYAITLLADGTIVLYDCREVMAKEVAKTQTKCDSLALCAFILPENNASTGVLHLVVIYSEHMVHTWKIDIANSTISYSAQCPLPQSLGEELHLAVPVDPVGYRFTIGNSLDSFGRDVLTTISKNGTLCNWTVGIQNGSMQWLQTSAVSTEKEEASKVSVSSTRKAVLADASATELSIWDTRNGLLEFHQKFDADRTISDLDWTTTPGDECVLGVGFTSKIVVLYCQQRFDYTNQNPSWCPFRRVDISGFTNHPIGDSIWLRNGTFVVGAGNQLFIQDAKIDVHEEVTQQLLGSRNTAQALSNNNSIFDICAIFNGPLPLYHPQCLIQLIFAGKKDLVRYILGVLLRRVKFAPVLEPSMVFDLDSDLGIGDTCMEYIMSDSTEVRDGKNVLQDQPNFSKDLGIELVQMLQKYALPYLTRHQQITLVSVVEAATQIFDYSRSLDENGIKYLLGFKLYNLHRGQKATMTMRDFNMALHSDSHHIITDLVESGISRNTSDILWPSVRDVGMAHWLETSKLREKFEMLAKNYFNYEGKRDPTRCTLYYLALKKKQVLVGLWRIASWHKEQGKTLKLLSNDFTTARWRSAALKNAYALLGKHRYEYAASFFLLGSSLKDAVDVIIKNMKDIALAIAVARVYEEEECGPVLQYIIEAHVFSAARKNSDRWSASWGLWMLKRKEKAVNALMGDLESISEYRLSSAQPSGVVTPTPVEVTLSRSFLVDDPVLAQLYKYLRSKVGIEEDLIRLQATQMHFLLKVSAIYQRMGCDLLGLDLVRNWRFTREDNANRWREEELVDMKREEVRNEKLQEEANLAQEKTELASDEKFSTKLNKPPPTAFAEPDMSAFDFGF